MKKENKEDDHQTMKEALNDMLKENRLQKGIDEVDVKVAWKNQMENLMRYTTSLKLKRGTLYVHLNSAVMREELSYGKKKIIKILNEEVGREVVQKLVLR